MRFQTKVHATRLKSVLIASAAALVVVSPAQAGKNSPAPIVYAGQAPQTGQTARAPTRTQSRITAPAPGEEGKRIAFRYPGSLVSAAPQPSSRNYASLDAPQISASQQITEAAITPDAFDAAATAERIAATRQPTVVASEPLAPLEPALPVTGQGSSSPAPVAITPAAVYSATPGSTPVFDETGIGVIYGDEFSGLPTANGEVFAQEGMTAAHPTLPLPSLVQVINVDTQKAIVVRVNDRGPFEDGAMLQLSKTAASALSFGPDDRANVRVRYLGPAPVSGPIMAAQATTTNDSLVLASYQPDRSQPASAPVIYASAPQPARSTTVQAGQGDYFVQVGAFSDIGNAQDFEASLGGSLPVVIVPARVNGADFFRVRVGPFTTRDSAADARDQLANSGIANGRIVSAN
ncbi:MAG: septal ring lytic transglycosylase RlpA family protein [Hyphomonas sp.]|uniref:septal ring lytic transglycosylase RlpA family protein n=1 Tax=Hyphomonas sp. TaxID=87 RepID=UPI0030021FDB